MLSTETLNDEEADGLEDESWLSLPNGERWWNSYAQRDVGDQTGIRVKILEQLDDAIFSAV